MTRKDDSVDQSWTKFNIIVMDEQIFGINLPEWVEEKMIKIIHQALFASQTNFDLRAPWVRPLLSYLKSNHTAWDAATVSRYLRRFVVLKYDEQNKNLLASMISYRAWFETGGIMRRNVRTIQRPDHRIAETPQTVEVRRVCGRQEIDLIFTSIKKRKPLWTDSLLRRWKPSTTIFPWWFKCSSFITVAYFV